MDLTLVIAILGCVIGILSFAFARKDKGEKDTGDAQYKMGIIDEKLANISKQIENLSLKLDNFDHEIDTRIDKAIETHEKAYHKRGE